MSPVPGPARVSETFDHRTHPLPGVEVPCGPRLRSVRPRRPHVESLLAALGLVFVAELGDKTQLVALGFGARHRLAPVLSGVLGATLPTRAIGLVGGVLFLGFAAKTLLDGDDADDEGDVATDDRSVVWSVAGAMFVAELGDKTMLATATLAAQGNPVITWVGATVGIILSGTLGVLLGRVFGAHLPERATRIASAVLFAAFGLALVVANV